MKTFVKRLFIRVCLQHGYHCAKLLCYTHQLGCTVLVEDPLIEPPNWKSTIFKRFRLPNPDTWFEYDIVHIYNIKKPGS